MRRLAIVDLSPSGHQPLFNEDQSVAVVFNGEIYNHLELRKQLEARGHLFRATTPTRRCWSTATRSGERICLGACTACSPSPSMTARVKALLRPGPLWQEAALSARRPAARSPSAFRQCGGWRSTARAPLRSIRSSPAPTCASVTFRRRYGVHRNHEGRARDAARDRSRHRRDAGGDLLPPGARLTPKTRGRTRCSNGWASRSTPRSGSTSWGMCRPASLCRAGSTPARPTVFANRHASPPKTFSIGFSSSDRG